MAGTLIVPVVDEGLGNSAYLVDLGTAGPTVTGGWPTTMRWTWAA